MSSAAEILVIILSVTLTIFLIVAIILGIYLIKLSAEIRRVAASAQETVDAVGKAAQGVAKLTSPLLIAKSLGDFIKRTGKKKGRT